jgi:integrase
MKYTFDSWIKSYAIGLVQQKRADGFAYLYEEYHLKKLDDFFALRFPNATSVTREIALEWTKIKPNESEHLRRVRVNALRQLSLYMLSLGCEAYVPQYNGNIPKPILYIPSRKEMSAFFAKLDTWGRKGNYFCCRTTNEYKVLFRLYYCCGLRVSEARLLKRGDVDFDKGILRILNSKGQKDRLVCLPHDGQQMMSDYLLYIEKMAPDSTWLFPGRSKEDPLSRQAVDQRFKDCWNALPFASEAYKCPTPHCLRHAFVVERMNNWMQQGIDTQEMLPYLSKYLGHKSPSETYYYYHLVDNAFAVIREKDTVSRRVIPEVLDYEEV